MTTNSRRPDPYLLEVQAWTGAVVETLRLSTHSISTRPTDAPANTFYDGRIKDPGKFSRILFDKAGAVSGHASVNVGFIELINADGRLDPWIGYGYGREFTLKALATTDTPASGAITVLTGVVDGIESSDATRTLRLRIRDRLADLDKPLLTTRYAGTTLSAGNTAEGDADLEGHLKPCAFGVNVNVPGLLVNRFNLLYQFAANAQASMVVYEGGLSLSSVGDFGTLSALNGAVVLPGQYATCLAQGIARLGGSAQRSVTADLIEGASASLRSAARVVGRVLDLAGFPSASRDSSTFDMVHTFNAAEVGCYVDGDDTTLDVVSKVLSSIGAVACPTATGVLQLIGVGEPSSATVAALTLRDLLTGTGMSLQMFAGPSSEGDGVPAWSVVLDWGRSWQVQGDGDLYGAVGDTRRALAGKEFRRVESNSSSVRTGWPHASQLSYQTLLSAQSAAEAEAARRLALHSVRRDRIVFPTPGSRVSGIELGQSVKVTMSRFGLSSGKNFLVVGREEDFARKITTLTLWG